MNTKIQTPNAAWPFRLDPTQNWAYWDQAFTPEECQRIIEIGESRAMEPGTVIGDDYVRDCDISWLYSVDELDWAFRKVTDIVMNLNERFFGFDLYGMSEGFQFTRYTAPGEYYGKHVDRITNGVVRKLSLVIQLDPPDAYEGGELILHTSDNPTVVNREQGYLVVFPSYTLHEVTPVTKGTRHSLVSWITGAPFK